MIDIEAANEYGVVVSNVPNYAAYTVSQFAIGLLMEICLNIGRQTDAVRAGDWLGIKNSGSSWEPTRMEFRDKTMGIIGCGAIGRQTAVIAMALGMRILACDQIKRAEWENSEFHYTSLETLLSESDIVSLHCPVTDKTRHIINMTSISKMKKSAILINTSRGHLINERDLASALNNGGLAAAGLDVLTDEPPMDDNPLLSAKNCYITPHVAWATPEAQVKLFDSIVENLLAFLAGKPRNVIKN
jgi:glycerate dehydrogenase